MNQPPSEFGKYVQRVTQWAPFTDVAETVGTDKATIWRWLYTDTAPSAPLVIKFARAYGVSPIEALIVAGYLTEADARMRTSSRPNLARASMSELIKELDRRADENGDAA